MVERHVAFYASCVDCLDQMHFVIRPVGSLRGQDVPEPVVASLIDAFRAAGVTAEFNRNVLHVVNRELDADFDPDNFEHVALFDPHHEWIEMRLRARTQQVVTIRALDLRVRFAAGEEIRMEISAKFTRPLLESDLAAAGLELADWLTDVDEQFAVCLARCRSSTV